MPMPPLTLAVIALGNLAGVAAAAMAVWLLSGVFLPAPDSLTLALQLLAVPGALVLAMSVAVMAARGVTGAYNPLDDPEPRLYRKTQRILANTVEQTAAFAPLLVALGATLPPPDSGILIALTIVFLVSRTIYAIGYLIHPMGRGFGMSATATVSAGIAGFLAWQAVA